MNDSTFKLLRSTLRGMKRIRLLRLETKLRCFECNELRRITDYFASGEALLDCQHRRPAFFLDTKVAQDFQTEVEARKIRKEILGFCQPTHNGAVRTFVENMEDANV